MSIHSKKKIKIKIKEKISASAVQNQTEKAKTEKPKEKKEKKKEERKVRDREPEATERECETERDREAAPRRREAVTPCRRDAVRPVTERLERQRARRRDPHRRLRERDPRRFPICPAHRYLLFNSYLFLQISKPCESVIWDSENQRNCACVLEVTELIWCLCCAAEPLKSELNLFCLSLAPPGLKSCVRPCFYLLSLSHNNITMLVAISIIWIVEELLTHHGKNIDIYLGNIKNNQLS